MNPFKFFSIIIKLIEPYIIEIIGYYSNIRTIRFLVKSCNPATFRTFSDKSRTCFFDNISFNFEDWKSICSQGTCTCGSKNTSELWVLWHLNVINPCRDFLPVKDWMRGNLIASVIPYAQNASACCANKSCCLCELEIIHHVIITVLGIMRKQFYCNRIRLFKSMAFKVRIYLNRFVPIKIDI